MENFNALLGYSSASITVPNWVSSLHAVVPPVCLLSCTTTCLRGVGLCLNVRGDKSPRSRHQCEVPVKSNGLNLCIFGPLPNKPLPSKDPPHTRANRNCQRTTQKRPQRQYPIWSQASHIRATHRWLLPLPSPPKAYAKKRKKEKRVSIYATLKE